MGVVYKADIRRDKLTNNLIEIDIVQLMNFLSDDVAEATDPQTH